MKVQREDAEEADELAPNVTPLLDMMFILIIFFLATSSFTQEERDEAIRLVKTSSKVPISTVSDSPLIINLDQTGRRTVDGRLVELPELEALMRSRLGKREDMEVVIRADLRATVKHLQETTDVCHRLGVKTPNVSYQVSP